LQPRSVPEQQSSPRDPQFPDGPSVGNAFAEAAFLNDCVARSRISAAKAKRGVVNFSVSRFADSAAGRLGLPGAYRMRMQVMAILALAVLALPTLICAVSRNARMVTNEGRTGNIPALTTNAGGLSIQRGIPFDGITLR